MEVEKKEGGASFPSNYVTIHQLRQRWLQQQHSSSSNHRDENDDDVESSKKPQNDAVSAHSPPAVTKSPSYNNKNKASSSSSNPNQQPPFSPISSSSSSSGASKKKPQNDAVSSPEKTKSSQQNHDNEVVSKTLNETRFRKGFNPNRPQKPKPEPTETDSANDQPISTNQISKKNKYKNTRNPTRVLPDQTLTGAASLPETDPKPELEVEAVVEKEQDLGGCRKSNRKKKKKKAVRESKMAPELEQVVVVEKKQLMESRECRDGDKKGVREFKDKTLSFDHNKHHAVGDNVVEPELEVEMEVVVEKRQKQRETRGRRNWDNKAVREFKPKTASFGHYNSNVDNNDDVGGVKAAEVDKVVGDGVKKNLRRGSGKFDHQEQGQGKQSFKAASFDHDQDMSETAVKESDAVNNDNYYYNTNATSDRGSNWRRGSGRFSGQGMRRPLSSKRLIETSKGQVWVKKGESTTPN